MPNSPNGNSLCPQVMSPHLVSPCIKPDGFTIRLSMHFFHSHGLILKKIPVCTLGRECAQKGLERDHEWTMVCIKFKSTLPEGCMKELSFTLHLSCIVTRNACSEIIREKCEIAQLHAADASKPSLLLIQTASQGCDYIPNVIVTCSCPDVRVERAALILSHFSFYI